MLRMYCVKDKLNRFFEPHVYDNDDVAKRDFALAIQKGSSLLASCPSDFELYFVGSFDQEVGKFLPLEPCKLIDGVSVLKKAGDKNV